MKGPEQMDKSTAPTAGVPGEESSSERDPCSSPPCKRLKQAVLNFQTFSTESSTSQENCLSNVESVNQVNCGGLVTAAPTTPTSNSTTNDDDDDEVMIIDSTPPKILSPLPDQDKQRKSDTPVRLLSSAEKKKKEEREKMREAKKKEKEEKSKEREQAKAAKEKERLEAKQKKEQARMEKQAEKEKREKEKLEKKMKEEKEKQEKKDKREEERRKKEEEENAKIGEKKRKEEEKRQQEEEMERKKLKAKNSFKSFFTKTASTIPKTLPKSVLKFETFEIQPHMSLAPVYRKQINEDCKQKLKTAIKVQCETTLYLEDLQKQKPLPPYHTVRRRKTVFKPACENQDTSNKEIIEVIDNDEDDDDTSESSSVIEIQDDDKKTVYMKAVFLKFCENNRPPYYGTQRKTSNKISPRNPFHKDEALLNYEVDSDDEWEEEEPGESLLDSEPEDDNEENDEEEEGGWMVPHGYLSDDEGIEEDDEQQHDNSSDKKEQQLAKAKAWERELKKRCKAMKPVCVGCMWPDGNEINDVLRRFEACLLVDGPSISISTPIDDDIQTGETTSLQADTGYRPAMYVPEEAMPDLIQFLHGSSDGLDKLMNTFRNHWSNKCRNAQAHPTLIGKGHISKRQLNIKIRSIAKKESRLYNKYRWYVHPSILASYGIEDLQTEIQEPHLKSISISPSIPNPASEKQVRSQPVDMMKGSYSQVQSNGIQIMKSQNIMPIQSNAVVKRRVALQPVIQKSGYAIPEVAIVGHSSQTITAQTTVKQTSVTLPSTVSYQTDTTNRLLATGNVPDQTLPNPVQDRNNQTIQVQHRVALQTITPNTDKNQTKPSGPLVKLMKPGSGLNTNKQETVAVKRQAPSQDFRASKVMKSEEMAIPVIINNDNNDTISTNSKQANECMQQCNGPQKIK